MPRRYLPGDATSPALVSRKPARTPLLLPEFRVVPGPGSMRAQKRRYPCDKANIRFSIHRRFPGALNIVTSCNGSVRSSGLPSNHDAA